MNSLITAPTIAMAANVSDSQHAPRYPVPKLRFAAVEHPFIVKNADKAMDMLGGVEVLEEVLRTDKPLSLRFHPNDPTSRNIVSLPDTTDNVLLRVTVPKRIGKRKRGSTGTFTPLQAPSPVMRDSKYLLRSMNDNKETTKVEAVGSVQKTHVWRSMPDFDHATRDSKFLSEIQSKVIPRDYSLLQQWNLPKTYGLQDTEVPPPSAFSTQPLPLPYMYSQPNSRQEVDDAPQEAETPKRDRRERNFTLLCSSNGPFPTSPPISAPNMESQYPAVRKFVPVLRDLFAQRPIWSRRALGNQMPEGTLTPSHKQALGYVAFSIRSGAWSHTLCAFGVDPCSDLKYRKFQTLATLNDQKHNRSKAKKRANRKSAPAIARPSHIFTGQGPIVEDGSTFQLCDLEDPQLKTLVDVDERHLLKVCEPEIFGWYGNGTLSKIRIILRTKISALRKGDPIPEAQFERLLAFPEQCEINVGGNQNDKDGPTFVPESASARELALEKAYREGCRNLGRSKIRNDTESGSSDTDSDISESVAEPEKRHTSSEHDLEEEHLAGVAEKGGVSPRTTDGDSPQVPGPHTLQEQRAGQGVNTDD